MESICRQMMLDPRGIALCATFVSGVLKKKLTELQLHLAVQLQQGHPWPRRSAPNGGSSSGDCTLSGRLRRAPSLKKATSRRATVRFSEEIGVARVLRAGRGGNFAGIVEGQLGLALSCLGSEGRQRSAGSALLRTCRCRLISFFHRSQHLGDGFSCSHSLSATVDRLRTEEIVLCCSWTSS